MSVSSLCSLRAISVAKTADTSNGVFFGKFSAISLWLLSVEKRKLPRQWRSVIIVAVGVLHITCFWWLQCVWYMDLIII